MNWKDSIKSHPFEKKESKEDQYNPIPILSFSSSCLVPHLSFPCRLFFCLYSDTAPASTKVLLFYFPVGFSFLFFF